MARSTRARPAGWGHQHPVLGAMAPRKAPCLNQPDSATVKGAAHRNQATKLSRRNHGVWCSKALLQHLVCRSAGETSFSFACLQKSFLSLCFGERFSLDREFKVGIFSFNILQLSSPLSCCDRKSDCTLIFVPPLGLVRFGSVCSLCPCEISSLLLALYNLLTEQRGDVLLMLFAHDVC